MTQTRNKVRKNRSKQTEKFGKEDSSLRTKRQKDYICFFNLNNMI
jgi:hypothetical protein